MRRSKAFKLIVACVAALIVAGLFFFIFRGHSSDAIVFQDETAQRMQSYREFISRQYLQTDILFANGSYSSDGSSSEKICLRFNEMNQAWDAYIPSDLIDDLHIYFTQFQGIQFEGDSTVYHSGDLIPTQDTNYKIRANLILWDGSTYSQDYSTTIYFFYGSGSASLYLTESDNSRLADLREDAAPDAVQANYAVYTCDSILMDHGQMEIRASDEKGYDQQESYDLMTSSGEAWCLLPDYKETAEQVRNKTALDLAHYLNIPETKYGEMVNVYENGQYLGLYLLTSSYSLDWNHSSERSFDAVASEDSVEEKRSSDHSSRTVRSGKSTVGTDDELKEVSWEDAPEEVKAYSAWYNSHEGTERQNSELYQNLWKVLDKDSFLRMYMLQDFMASWQGDFQVFQSLGGTKSSSSESHGGNLMMAGNPWNFILSCGYTTRQDYPILTRQSLWLCNHLRTSDGDEISRWISFLAKLGDEEEFQAELKSLWQSEFHATAEQFIQNDLPMITYESVSSGTMSNHLYRQENVESDTSVWNLRQWLIHRTDFVNDYLNEPEHYVRLVFSTALGDLNYYVKEGETISLLPVKDNGEGSDYYSQNGDYADITGWIDEDGNALQADTIITKEMEGTRFSPVGE